MAQGRRRAPRPSGRPPAPTRHLRRPRRAFCRSRVSRLRLHQRHGRARRSRASRVHRRGPAQGQGAGLRSNAPRGIRLPRYWGAGQAIHATDRWRDGDGLPRAFASSGRRCESDRRRCSLELATEDFPLKRIHYAWIVAAVTFVALMGAAGFRATPSVLIVPLQNEFGWNRAVISVAVSINLILFGLTGPFAAALMDRFGIRAVTVGALVTVAGGALLTTIMNAPWQLYLLWGVVVGLGTGCMASVLAATVAGRWFVHRRGLVLGALTAAGAPGQLIFLPFLGWLAQNRGWRSAAITVGIAALAVVPIVAFFLRNRPADLGLRAYGATVADTGPLSVGNPIRNAFRGLGLGVRSRDFWLLAGSFFICGASTNGLIGTHLIPASMDHGMAEVTAASLLAVIGIFDVVGTLVSGVLTDRFDSRWLLFWYYGLRGLSLLFLPYAFGTAYFGLILFIVFYGLDWVATVPPTVQLARRLFGQQNFTIVYGWIFAAHQLGAASIALAAGAVRTFFGDYQLAFMSSGLLCLIAAGLVLRIVRIRRTEGPELPVPAEAPAYS